MTLALVRTDARFANKVQGCAESRDAKAARQHAPADARPRPGSALGELINSALFSSCGVGGARDRQLQQPGRVGKEDRVALRLGDVEVLDQLDGARFERGQRRGLASAARP